MRVRLLVTGLDDLDAKLATVGGAVANRVARSALTRGASQMAKFQRAAVPAVKTKGHSRKAIQGTIGFRTLREKSRGAVEAKAGIGVGKRASKKKGAGRATRTAAFAEKVASGQYAPHAHLLALGTRDRYAGLKGVRQRIGGKQQVVEWRPTHRINVLKRGAVRMGSQLRYVGRVKPNDYIARTASANSASVQAIIRNWAQKKFDEFWRTGKSTDLATERRVS